MTEITETTAEMEQTEATEPTRGVQMPEVEVPGNVDCIFEELKLRTLRKSNFYHKNAK